MTATKDAGRRKTETKVVAEVGVRTAEARRERKVKAKARKDSTLKASSRKCKNRWKRWRKRPRRLATLIRERCSSRRQSAKRWKIKRAARNGLKP